MISAKRITGWVWNNIPILRHLVLWPPGHYYSPIPSIREIKRAHDKIFNKDVEVAAINLHEEHQIELLEQLKPWYDEIPFTASKQEGLRYYFQNPFYSFGDGAFLHCLIRHFKPRRIIEAGSGFSSAVVLDTNELFFANTIACTFIEPYPQRLKSLLKPGDWQRITVMETKLQDVAPAVFDTLEAGDFLLVDSTHVSKTNSDVNYLVFNILPALRRGVIIHFHDIFYPFEYPSRWVYAGYAWNEAYLLRAFLQYNDTFEIVFYNSLIGYKHREKLARDFPLCAAHPGASMWLRKVR